MQQLNVRNNEDVKCNCGKEQPIKFISTTKKTLHCSRCMTNGDRLVEYETFQKALENFHGKRKNNIEETLKQVESTERLYNKIFANMKSEIEKYQDTINEKKILYESFQYKDLESLLVKLTLTLDQNEDIFFEFSGDKSLSIIKKKLQKMNLHVIVECKELEKKTWCTEAKKLQGEGQRVFFLDDYVLIQENEKKINVMNQDSVILYSRSFDNKITELYKSPNNKIILAQEPNYNLNFMIQENKKFIEKQIPLNKNIQQLIFNQASNLIIYSCQSCIEFLQIKDQEIIPIKQNLPHDKHEGNDVPVYALAESNNQVVSMNMLGSIKIYSISNLENIQIKYTSKFDINPQVYDFLHYQDCWILAGIMSSSFQILQVNEKQKVINLLKEQEISEPNNQAKIIFKQNLLVQLTPNKISIYSIRNAEVQNIVQIDCESCELTSCDISEDGTQLIVTGKTTMIYNLFW